VLKRTRFAALPNPFFNAPLTQAETSSIHTEGSASQTEGSASQTEGSASQAESFSTKAEESSTQAEEFFPGAFWADLYLKIPRICTARIGMTSYFCTDSKNKA